MLNINPDKIIQDLKGKKFTSLSKTIDTYHILDRVFCIGDIEPGIGGLTESYIHFWNDYDDALNLKPEDRSPIKLKIDSPGGELSEAFTIIDSIKLSKTPVWTFCIGQAYSAGFLIFISGDKRFAFPHSTLLFHEGYAGTSGSSSQFQNFSTFYKKQLQQLKQIVLVNSAISDSEYESFKTEDVWFTATEAKEKGLVDEIITEFK